MTQLFGICNLNGASNLQVLLSVCLVEVKSFVSLGSGRMSQMPTACVCLVLTAIKLVP